MPAKIFTWWAIPVEPAAHFSTCESHSYSLAEHPLAVLGAVAHPAESPQTLSMLSSQGLHFPLKAFTVVKRSSGSFRTETKPTTLSLGCVFPEPLHCCVRYKNDPLLLSLADTMFSTLSRFNHCHHPWQVGGSFSSSWVDVGVCYPPVKEW